MNKKYELIEDSFIEYPARKLYRIRALRDFGNVKAGDIGGYIEEEKNLSHEGNAWVGDDAQISCGASVTVDAQVYGNAKLFGNAVVTGKAQVCGDTQMCSVRVWGEALMRGDGEVYSNAPQPQSA